MARGRTLALVGESGCGKTTTGKAIVQLLRAQARIEGRALLEGRNLFELQGEALLAARRDVQIIFQDPFASLNPRLRVFELLEEGLQALHPQLDAAARRQRIEDLSERVGLRRDALERFPHEFSGGQRQRIAIARALAVQPKLVVCDEPTSALDVSVQAQILNLLRELQRDMGLSYLFITHNIGVVEYIADEVAVMRGGAIVEQGRCGDVLGSPAARVHAGAAGGGAAFDAGHLRLASCCRPAVVAPAQHRSGCKSGGQPTAASFPATGDCAETKLGARFRAFPRDSRSSSAALSAAFRGIAPGVGQRAVRSRIRLQKSLQRKQLLHKAGTFPARASRSNSTVPRSPRYVQEDEDLQRVDAGFWRQPAGGDSADFGLGAARGDHGLVDQAGRGRRRAAGADTDAHRHRPHRRADHRTADADHLGDVVVGPDAARPPGSQ